MSDIQKEVKQKKSFEWPQSNGERVVCKEKIKILEENYQEIQQALQDVFEDALLMGVNEAWMRCLLKRIVDQLRSPIR